MNAIVKPRAPGVLPTLPAIPQPSPTLAQWLKAIGDYTLNHETDPFGADRDAWFVYRMPASQTVEEAKSVLTVLDQWLMPAEPEIVRNWLRPLVAAVSNPPTENDFNARAAVVAIVCASLAIGVFTVETQRQAIIRFKFWPSASEVHELLSDEEARLLHKRREAQRLASLRPIEELERQRHERWEAGRKREEQYNREQREAREAAAAREEAKRQREDDALGQADLNRLQAKHGALVSATVEDLATAQTAMFAKGFSTGHKWLVALNAGEEWAIQALVGAHARAHASKDETA